MSNDLVGEKSSKSLSKNYVFTYRVLPILRHMKSGEYPAKIARMLGISKQLCHYYVKRLERSGLIRKEVRSNIVFYSVTERVKDILERLELGLGLAPMYRRVFKQYWDNSMFARVRANLLGKIDAWLNWRGGNAGFEWK